VFNARKVPGLFARLAVFGVAVLIVAGSVVSTSLQAARASGPNVTDYYLPFGGGDPWGTAFDGSGRVWVAAPGCDVAPSCPSSTPPGHLALFDPSANGWPTVVSLPAGYGQPLFVRVDSAGKVWFTMPVTNSIGVYDPVANTVSQWAVPTPSAGPWDLAIDSTGKIWFTEHYTNQIGSFDPVTQTFHEVATPTAGSDPYGITVDSSNNIWFTENPDTVAQIGEFTSKGVMNEYKIRNTPTAGTGLTPHLITIAPNGSIWWSEGFASGVGTLDPANAQPGTNNGVTEYLYTPSCSSCGSHTSGIGADTHGSIWVDDSNQNTFGSLPVGGGTFSFYNAPTSNAHPHDGLNVDSQNRVWFDEEFANKLAVAVPSATSAPVISGFSPASGPVGSSVMISGSGLTGATAVAFNGTKATGYTVNSDTQITATVPTGASTGPVSVTTPGGTATSTTSFTVTTTTGTSLGTDTFQRANQALWGTASDGQTWGGDANTKSPFSVSNNAGVVSNTSGNSYSAVLGPAAANAEVYATGSMSSYANSNVGDVLRWTDGNDWYKAYIDGHNLVLQKKVAGTATTLATVPFAATAGTSYTVHFRVVGSTLTANVWASSGTEPSGWMITATDTSLTSGQCGLRLLVNSGTATISNFRALTA
jgi:streptogramin lyase